MEWTHGTASEYIGMDIAKYKKSRKKRKNGRRYIKKRTGGITEGKSIHHCSQESLSWHAAQRKSLPALFMKDSVRKGR